MYEYGEIYAVKAAVIGNPIPMPMQYRNLTTIKEVRFQQKTERSPDIVRIIALMNMNEALPILSANPCKRVPRGTPALTMANTSDCYKMERFQLEVSTGNMSPNAIVSQPSLRFKRLRGLHICYCAGP